MAISAIVVRGYGSFGGIALLPTRGYGIGIEQEGATHLRRTVIPGMIHRQLSLGGLNRVAGVDKIDRSRTPDGLRRLVDMLLEK